jgi:ribonuclease P protein component
VTRAEAPSSGYLTLKTRADFVAASRAGRASSPSMVVQGRARGDGDDAIRVGYTCSRKVGNAVARNRAKRRLRAAARAAIPQSGRPGWDYVLIGRHGATASRRFADLVQDLSTAIARIAR